MHFLIKPIQHIVCLSVITFLSAHTFGQEMKEVIVSRAYRQVPEGKVWLISNQEPHKVVFSERALLSGTFCYASVYSNPRHLFGISYYESSESENKRNKIIGFTFQSMEETIGSDVYLIKPHFILHHQNGVDAIKNSLSWEFEPMEIVFYPGTVAFTTGCISEITVFEREMTETEKQRIRNP